MTKRYNILLLLVGIGVFCGCNITKNLDDGELLITKTTIEFENPKEIRNEKKFKSELTNTVKPQPSSGGLNLSTWLYQWGETSKKEKGIRKWLQRNLGKAPALYDAQAQSRNRMRLKTLLKDNGFFRSDVEIDTTVNGKEIEMKYFLRTYGQYRIREIYLPDDSTNIGRLVHENKGESLLVRGDFYNEPLLAKERRRINDLALKAGYLQFNENFVYYFLDTIVGNYNADLYIRVKPPENSGDHVQFKLGKTTVFPNYNLTEPVNTQQLDTVYYSPEMKVVESQHLIAHKVLDRMILQSEGEIVKKERQDISVNHLLDLGVFKFVNLKYQQKGDSLNPVLDRIFYLTPDFNQKVSADLELNNRSGGFYGTAVSANYRHLNLFKKAVQFNTNLSLGVETQIGNNLAFINTFDIGFEAGFSIPRFIVPFKVKRYSGRHVPRTSLTIGNNFQRRSGLFTLNSTNVKFGYQWLETSEKQHTLYPISLNRVQTLQVSERFDSLLNVQKRLKESFQNRLIAGLDYSYVLTKQDTDPRLYFRGNIRTSGNLLQLADEVFGLPKDEEGRAELFTMPYAQFTSVELDLRTYKSFGNNLLALRFSPALGVAYGNSDVLPFIEQFFVGGANSLRAFRLRGIGPGSFARESAPEVGVERQAIDQTGDIKLEMSVEYRFGIWQYFKGAFFVDAGNVWLMNNSEGLNVDFRFDRFYKQIAIGAGIGLRLDIDFIVLRLDIATPVRKPYFNEDFQWSFDRFDFGDNNWRNENLIYNIAIGYPF